MKNWLSAAFIFRAMSSSRLFIRLSVSRGRFAHGENLEKNSAHSAVQSHFLACSLSKGGELMRILIEGYLLSRKFFSLAARRVNDRVTIELTIDDVPSTGDERQVGEAIGCWLWFGTSNRPGAEDLCKH